mmetsp:Transcript_25633/g.73756  ORF Transcript_25633/g.73756 Transcript_25633/m.73756 type:complete len:229 (-) Transcript_25633:599-1285(-)
MEAHPVIGVLDDERCLQARLHRLNRVHPSLVPQRLELYQRLGRLVVHFDELLGVLAGENSRVALELPHGALDPLVQVPRPRDVTRHGGQVAHQWWSSLALLVLVLHLAQLLPVVEEDHLELILQVLAQVLTLQNALKLVEQLQRGLDRGDRLEGLIDELPELALQIGDPDVELYIVAVEAVVLEVQQIVPLVPKLREVLVEKLYQRLHSVETVLRQGLKLVDRPEHVD